jgi:hypothetical protein
MFRRSCGCVHGKYYLIVCRSLRSTFQQPRTFSRIISYPFIIFRILRALSSHDNEWKVTLRSYVWVHPNPNIARVGTGSAKARIGSKSSTSKAQGRNRQWRRVAVGWKYFGLYSSVRKWLNLEISRLKPRQNFLRIIFLLYLSQPLSVFCAIPSINILTLCCIV